MTQINLQLPLKVGVIEARRLHVSQETAAYQQLCRRAGEYYDQCAPRGIDSPGAVPGVEPARRMFRSLGVDPTRIRPASEALLRRALKRRELYRINQLVDVGNWCSLDFLLPLGLYDRGSLRGTVNIRQGSEGESYIGIANKVVNLSGRYTLADDEGPFGSPVTDSLRTSIQTTTTECLMTIFAPPSLATTKLEHCLAQSAQRMTEYCGGEIVREQILTGPGAS